MTTHNRPPASPLSGVVKRLVSDRGFGFIQTPQGHEYFFHRSACDDFDRLREGHQVTFTPGQGAKGPRADHVVTVN